MSNQKVRDLCARQSVDPLSWWAVRTCWSDNVSNNDSTEFLRNFHRLPGAFGLGVCALHSDVVCPCGDRRLDGKDPAALLGSLSGAAELGGSRYSGAEIPQGGGKLEFTVIGDAVNVAVRVEQLTKTTGDAILLTQQCVDALASRPPGLVDRGFHVLKGKSAALQVFSLNQQTQHAG
jgi:hypothetical protein